MTPKTTSEARQELFKVSAHYAYSIWEPIEFIYNKHGQLIIGRLSTICEYREKHPEEFRYSTFETVMPGICMGLGFLLLCFIIGQGIS